MKIWCLLGDPNEYDAVGNVLYGWWQTKPSLTLVGEKLGLIFPANNDDHTLLVVKLWSGEGIRFENVDYRLVEVEEGRTPGEELKRKKK